MKIKHKRRFVDDNSELRKNDSVEVYLTNFYWQAVVKAM